MNMCKHKQWSQLLNISNIHNIVGDEDQDDDGDDDYIRRKDEKRGEVIKK